MAWATFSRLLRTAAAALPLAAVLSVAAFADDAQSPANAPTAQPAPAQAQGPTGFPAQPPPANKPGFLHQLETWWNDGVADLSAKMKSSINKPDDSNKPAVPSNKQTDQAINDASAATAQALKDMTQATKDAATAIVKLPTTRMFEVHERCVVAGNGAPDCQTTADAVCRTKGFEAGQPLDVSTAQECPARVMLSGQPPAEGECKNVTTILRAICR